MIRSLSMTVPMCFLVLSLSAKAEFVPELVKDSLTVMSYNVQNLFDADHDEGKDDYTFLPKSFPGKMEECAKIKIPTYRELCEKTDWRTDLVNLKISQIKKAVGHQGFIPDILALSEVENENVLNMLAREVGYDHFYLTTGNDSRGIDVALLFNEQRIQHVSHKQIEVKFKGNGNMKTRNVLRVLFRLKNFNAKGGKGAAPILAVYVAHWPSQSNPSKYRIAVAEIMKADIEQGAKKYGANNYHVLVTGDLNTLEQESPNGIKDVLGDESWALRLFDAEVLAREQGVKMVPPGTFFFKKDNSWNRLDRMLVSKNMTGSGQITANVKTFKNLAPAFMTYVYHDKSGTAIPNVPVGYDFGAESASKAGYSDHLPIFMSLNITN